MTTKEKIDEAEYNLKNLKRATQSRIFRFQLSNFLSSATSIIEHLLEENNIRYGLNVERVNIRKFKELAEKLTNPEAIRFIDWFAERREDIGKNHEYGFLLDKRNVNVHREPAKPKFHRVTVPTKVPDIQAGGTLQTIEFNFRSPKAKETIRQVATNEVSVEIKKAIHQRFFSENHDTNVVDLCGMYLKRIKGMVKEARSTFK